MESILKFGHVSIHYGERIAVDDFTEEIKTGEFVSLIGPNGSGKSTLIGAVTGALPLAGGIIHLGGKDNSTYKVKQRAQVTAVVPQHFSTNFAFKVKDIVMMGRNPYLKRMQAESAYDIEVVDEAMRLTSISHLKERNIISLSGGERQRVIIAGALAQQPALLILDEPTNHLDIQYNLDIMQMIKRQNLEKGLTVFAVLHDINMAARFSDRIILMDQGRLIKSGSVDEIMTEEVLRPVYKIDLVVRSNRLTGAKEIVPLRMNTQNTDKGLRVHVICGGGSGELLLEELRNRGFHVSCGVVNLGDSDYEVCESLGIPAVAEFPASAISDDSYARNLALANDSDIVVLTDMAIGNGNLKNVEILKNLDPKTEILIVKSGERDYTGGAGDAIISGLLAEKKAYEIEAQMIVTELELRTGRAL